MQNPDMSEYLLSLVIITDYPEAWQGHFSSPDLLRCSVCSDTLYWGPQSMDCLFSYQCVNVVILLRLNHSQKDLRRETFAFLWGLWHWSIKFLVVKMQYFGSLCILFWIFLCLMQICDSLQFNIGKSVYR